MEVLPIGVTILDRNLYLQYINSRHAELNHLKLEQQLGRHLREFLPQAADVIEPKLQFVIDTGRPLVNQEIRGSTPLANGRHLYRLASYYPVMAGQSVSHVVAIIRDAAVDDFQHQLHTESQQRLLRVLDNLFAFVGVLDLDGTLINANRAPLEAAGISLADVIGKKFWDCYWWSYCSDIQQQLKEAIAICQQGGISRFDVPVRMLNGELMWIDFMLAPLRNQAGEITHLIPSGIDIMKRHQSEAALHQSEERLRSVIESSDDAIITKSLDGLVTSWNPAAERLLGYSCSEMLGQSITKLFPSSKVREEQELLKRIASGERVASFETERIHRNGKTVYVSITISPLRDRAGKVIGACKLARDISPQKQQMQMLEQALEEKTVLLHEVHHRVKNNLQIVSSLLNLQARKASPEVASALGESQSRIKSMALIHQLLYESSDMSEVGLSDFLKGLINLSGSMYGIEKKGIQLRLEDDSQGVCLDMQRMIPCGLALNEL
ncbi:PAS domain-containing protein [Undibacterium rugosum]|uniref:PAS domain-containing protein n=1 Tax=Undibacterium rugosum TaxID=2762291 RepID=UPI001E46B181|nr:PAS domain-containing protein [Undibacterium rugosum]